MTDFIISTLLLSIGVSGIVLLWSIVTSSKIKSKLEIILEATKHRKENNSMYLSYFQTVNKLKLVSPEDLLDFCDYDTEVFQVYIKQEYRHHDIGFWENLHRLETDTMFWEKNHLSKEGKWFLQTMQTIYK